jgi:hypothetical protein
MKAARTYLLVLALAGPLSARGQSSIEIVGGATYDFGSMFRGEVVERTFTIRNTGKDTLVIEDVQASCGCTGTVVSTNRLGPGKSGTLKVTFSSRNFSGSVHKLITIRSNASNAPVTTLEFTANVIQEIFLDPKQFWFKDAYVGKVSKLTIKIRNAGRDPLTLKGYRTTLEGFTLTLPTGQISPGETVDIAAELKPGKVIPVLAEAAFIQTSNPRDAEIYIPIFGNTKEFKFE